MAAPVVVDAWRNREYVFDLYSRMLRDRIIVLEDGKIAGMGRHEELMRDCEVYRQIALSQLSKEELA